MKVTKRTISLILAVLMLIGTFAGCAQNEVDDGSPTAGQTQTVSPSGSNESESRTIVNTDGSTIQVPAQVERIAAIYGPAYESLVLLGAEDRIVCQGGFTPDNYPWCDVVFKTPRVPPKISFGSDLNMEELMSYSPDFVINFDQPETTSLMENAGLSVLPVVSEADFYFIPKLLTVFAEALGDEEALSMAEAYNTYFDEKVKMVTDITSQIPEEERPTVYFAQNSILSSIGEGNKLVTMIELAGGVCVTADTDIAFLAELSPEQVAEWNPDYILLDHVATQSQTEPGDPWVNQLAEINSNPQYSTITAVKNGDVYASPSGVFFWDSGVQGILQLLWTAKILHPDAFSDLDMEKELCEFYEEFFHYDLSSEEAQRILQRQNPESYQGPTS